MSITSGVSLFGAQRPQPEVNPDKYAQQYAQQNGISIDEAKQQLRTRFGEPQQPPGAPGAALSSGNVDGSSQRNQLPPEAYELQALGIPLDVIQQGDDAIKNFAEDNNIQLPEKKMGANIDFKA